jgi:glutathione S-transferase
MNALAVPPIRLFQFPPMFGVPNVSPFCCKMETWLRIAGLPYEVVNTPDPRKGPRKKLPFIEDGGVRIADTALIIAHLVRTRGVDPDAGLTDAQRATALLVQRTLEEHYAFVAAYTHLVREDGQKHTRARFNAIPGFIRPFVANAVLKQVKALLWHQGLLRHTDADILESGVRDWEAVLAVMSDGPYFLGDRATNIDATVFGTLATTVFTPIESPIRDFLRSRPGIMAYAERMRAQFFPELVPSVAAA